MSKLGEFYLNPGMEKHTISAEGGRSFGEGQPNTTELVKVDLYLRIEALVKDSQIQLIPIARIDGGR